jgi:Cu/Ag efflux protein CusF
VTPRAMTVRASAAALLAVLALAAWISCGGEKGDVRPDTDMYTVRGIVEKLPAAEGPDKSLYIHHAAIADFRDENGKTVGMMAMTMPFPVGDGVSLDGIEPGDPVEFTFSVRWRPETGYKVTAIHELPAGTVIHFDEETAGGQ